MQVALLSLPHSRPRPHSRPHPHRSSTAARRLGAHDRSAPSEHLAGDSKSGFTRYWEYGRYGGTFGAVRPRGPIPNLVIGDDGLPTQASLDRLMRALSQKVGKGHLIVARVWPGADAEAVDDFARNRMNDKNREPYGLGNTCQDFADDAVQAGLGWFGFDPSAFFHSYGL